jgi:hypothetical protein
MSISTLPAVSGGSNDEGATLVASATVAEAGSKVPASVEAGTYSITFYGNGSLNVYSYDGTGNGRFLGSIDASVAGSNSVIATVTTASSGFAFSGANGTVVIRKFAGSQVAGIVDTSAIALPAGLATATGNPFRNATNGSRWVAICSHEGGSGTRQVGYSDDGIFWTFAANMPVALYWADITYANGMFVAIGGNNWAGNSNTNVVVTSTDGITWTQRALPSTTWWTGVTYGNGRFVAVAGGTATSTTAAAYSTDGVTWTAATLPSALQWTDVEYGNNLFVAIATGSNNLATSTDGINWTARTFASTGGWRRIVWAGTRFVVIGAYISNPQLSTDGITWTNGSSYQGSASYEWHSMDYVNGVVLIGNTNYSVMSYSTNDGTSWVGASMPSTYYMSFLWNGSRFIAINQTPSSAAIGSNPPNPWTFIGTGNTANGGGIYYVNNLYVSVAPGSSNLATSPDGMNWTTRSIGFNHNWNSITYGNGVYLLTIGDTSNGSTQSSICYTSPNLTTWTQRSLPSTQAYKRAVFGNGRFVIPASYSGAPQTPVTSTDGVNWTFVSGISSYGSVMCFGKGRFVALPQYPASTASTSVDGVNWTIVDLPSGHNPTFTSVSYGNGVFVAIANTWTTGGGPVYTSVDGYTWVKQQTATSIVPAANTQIAFANGYFGFVWNQRAHFSTNGKSWVVGGSLSAAYPMAGGGPNGIVFANDNGPAFAKSGTKVTIS